jgi:hypothetical protein
VTATGTTTATANCTGGMHAIGGGGTANTGSLTASYPSNNSGNVQTGTNPSAWTAKFTTGATGSVYTICAP